MGLNIEVNPSELGLGFMMTLKASAEATLQDLGVEDAELSVRLIDEQEMRTLNRKYAGHDETTDVLSFDSGDRDPETGATYLGDVVIAPTVAIAAAAAGGHGLREELGLLTVHGVLHLLGFDHDQPESKQQMWQAQNRILARLGNPARAQ